jgi:hypothetical protein
MKPYVFSRRKPLTKPQFSRKRNRHCIRKRRSKQKRERDRKSRRGSSDDRCIAKGDKATSVETLSTLAISKLTKESLISGRQFMSVYNV